ncbi:hypothetical protein Pcinc_022379 [Petrolisthes cinctipes]|uniref:Uncharacterized protein n=1 Tax=Petrolisthes cinctipes TaxID=88211 RepID=A0AAE1FFL4_PETCI|nr:hypothetical protein Pcinc_022379 [Petrolisthes cinctipes]
MSSGVSKLNTIPLTPATPTASHTSSPLPMASHTPVMVKEVVKMLSPHSKHVLLDLTFGGGGHTKALLEAVPGVRVVCLDRDPSVLTHVTTLQQMYPGRVLPLLGCFSDLPKLLTRLKIPGNSFDGVLMDLGASSMQFDNPERGFMVSRDGPLDMRMDGNRVPGRATAADVLAHCNEVELYKVLKYYGEEKNARKIARALVESRCLFRCPQTTLELADLVAEVVGSDVRLDKLQRFAHPATKTFQALRILVNNELNELDFAVRASHHYLRPGGLMVTLSFHSLEDTIIKRHITGVDIDDTPKTIGLGLAKHRTSLSTYTSWEMEQLTAPRWCQLTRHVLLPTPDEVTANPRSRSAKLRAAKKL